MNKHNDYRTTKLESLVNKVSLGNGLSANEAREMAVLAIDLSDDLSIEPNLHNPKQIMAATELYKYPSLLKEMERRYGNKSGGPQVLECILGWAALICVGMAIYSSGWYLVGSLVSWIWSGRLHNAAKWIGCKRLAGLISLLSIAEMAAYAELGDNEHTAVMAGILNSRS